MLKEIYLAGGCFWAVEHFFSLVKGIIKTEVGYANGKTKNPSYYDVCHGSGHVEVVKVTFDTLILSLEEILSLFYQIIDPTSYQKQGNDQGVQYRTGIYYTNASDYSIIQNSLDSLQESFTEKILIECLPLRNYTKASWFHQNYLKKNKGGYCHIEPKFFEIAKQYIPKQNKMGDLTYEITKRKKTEPPFDNAYWDFQKEGIYVDIETGIPLFSSRDKFQSHCGWPTFSSSINPDALDQKWDFQDKMIRREIISSSSKNHLGHLFFGGPKELGGKRFCVNSASLSFIPKEEMTIKGYANYLDFIKKED